MKQPMVHIRVNDDAPADLALGTKKLAAGEEYEIERKHLRARVGKKVLADYLTEVEPEAPAPKAAAKKKAR